MFNSTLLYKPEKSDIFICSFPICGSTWLQNIIWLILHDGNSINENLHVLGKLPILEFQDAEGVGKINDKDVSRILKTHFPVKMIPWSDDAKYLFILRDPKDVVVSLYYHICGFSRNQRPVKMTLTEVFNLFMKGKTVYGDFFYYLQSVLSIQSSNTLILHYENLKLNPEKEILKIGKFLSTSAKEKLTKNNTILLKTVAQKSSIMRMKQQDKFWSPSPRLPGWPFIRKGETGDWKIHLTKLQVTQICTRIQETTP